MVSPVPAIRGAIVAPSTLRSGRGVYGKFTVPEPEIEAYWLMGFALLLMLHEPLFVLGSMNANCPVKLNEPVIPA